jgi:hypothetical protein
VLTVEEKQAWEQNGMCIDKLKVLTCFAQQGKRRDREMNSERVVLFYLFIYHGLPFFRCESCS